MSKFIEQRQVILQRMAQIDQMEDGSLKAEFRPGADPSHSLAPTTSIRCGRTARTTPNGWPALAPSGCARRWKAASGLSNWPGNALS